MNQYKIESMVGGSWFPIAGPWEAESEIDAIDCAWDFAYDCDIEVEGVRATLVGDTNAIPVVRMVHEGPSPECMTGEEFSLEGWDSIDTRTEDDQITYSEACELYLKDGR